MADDSTGTTEINPKHAEAAYLEVADQAKALPASAVQVPRIRVNEVTLTALRVARFINEPQARARFLALPGLDSRDINQLSSYALALWHAHTRRQVSEAVAGGARVSAELLERASERRARMLQLLEFFVADRPRVMAEVAAIKAGNGYLDVASDLGELARLHRQNDDRISGDTSGRYRADDAEGALSDATAIVRELSQSTDPREAEVWADALARTWTLLLTAYERIARAATWLYGERPDFDELFPSLFAAGRRAGRPASRGEAVAAPAP